VAVVAQMERFVVRLKADKSRVTVSKGGASSA
jgi:hypothetical protein